MITPSRLALSAAAALTAALLLTACASSPGEQSPTSSATPDGSGASTAPGDDHDDIEAAWLDDGRMFALVTWGSSTCVPTIGDVTADGQRVAVELLDVPADQVCTADLAPRASVGALPERVDPTKDVEFTVTLAGVTDDDDLDGNPALTGLPGQSTEFESSAGWFDDEGIVLLTWGSSSCPPIVEGVEEASGGATVTFTTEDRACTMDMAPRATVLGVSETDDDADFTLTLVGDNLDGTVNVLRG
jgi:hypothetical protein